MRIWLLDDGHARYGLARQKKAVGGKQQDSTAPASESDRRLECRRKAAGGRSWARAGRSARFVAILTGLRLEDTEAADHLLGRKTEKGVEGSRAGREVRVTGHPPDTAEPYT